MEIRRLLLLFSFPLITYLMITLSVIATPWFRWSTNALSNLGNIHRSDVACLFNFGLSTGGLLLIIYSLIYLRKVTSYSWICFSFTGYVQLLIGVFNEEYGFIHIVIAVIFYLSLSISQIVYGREKKSRLAILVASIYWIIWILYFFNRGNMGLAMPELVTSLIIVFYLLIYEIKNIY